MKSTINAIFIILCCCVCFNSHEVLGQSTKFHKIQQYLDKATEANLTGVTVYIESAKYGKWIGTSGYSNLEQKTTLKTDDIFAIGSISKMYCAVAVLKLVDEGKLKLEDKISRYLSEEIISNSPNAEDVTIRQLLQHTSGFVNYNKDPELNDLYLTGNLKLDTVSHIEALRRYFFGKPALSEPGTEYHYSSTNYLLLTMIMDQILPDGHEKYFRDMTDALSLTKTWYKETPPKMVQHYGDLNLDASSENLTIQTLETTNWYSGDDGHYASVEDAVHFIQALLVDKKILSESSLKEMKTGNDPKNPDYGLGLMIDTGFPYGILYGHSGRGIGMTTDLYYFPRQEMTIAIFSNSGLRSASKSFAEAFYKMRKKIMLKLFLF